MKPELERFLANARGTAATAKVRSLAELEQQQQDAAESSWSFAALRGRLVELSARGASATLTAAIELVAEAQQQREPVAWIALAQSSFYPPDVAASGVDLAALAVVRVPDAIAAARAAERLLRSGAFGLVVLDLAGVNASAPDLSMPIQGRLVTLAQTHDAAVVCITEKSAETASLGSLVSLRAAAARERPQQGSEFGVTVRAVKDKRRGPGWSWHVRRVGPAGLR